MNIQHEQMKAKCEKKNKRQGQEKLNKKEETRTHFQQIFSKVCSSLPKEVEGR